MQMQRTGLEAEAGRGISALQNGDFTTARDAFDAVTRSGTGSAQAWLFLAQACDGLDDRTAALAALDQVLRIDKVNTFALLMKGDIYARGRDDRAAVSFYRMGLRAAAAIQGSPGDLAERVARAEKVVAEAEQRFQAKLQRTLTERGFDAVPPRFAEALGIASGEQPVYLQQPTSFYFPGLPQRAWYDGAAFPWVAELEAAVPDMRAEVEAVLADERGLEPYVREHSERASRGHSLLNDASWSAFHLWKEGERVEENAARVPLIMRLLELPPVPRIAGRSPMAMISILKSGTHIPPHTGMLNTRLICHVPLVVPGDCSLRVGAETREVVEGKAMIFDDSFEHEAWNNGPSARAVLLFEIWRPELDEAERAALTAMYEAVTGYDTPGDD
ncbi:aspartyl/asparaginyl beta-hydroxylase domain-containing protein [Sphingomonas sp. URHD0057]|uniref:aspartyl/asparaginyl beta-hydroxylase domain-containing protein n=1 Tax=Sphingomonas sp. URHD0057 TaxID=1380389 RepID=UPI000686B3F0|nr:aspartyl/asparaginyl beta-hydroxylase domain-containing protein [Sphingomonas sp. URHD0057]